MNWLSRRRLLTFLGLGAVGFGAVAMTPPVRLSAQGHVNGSLLPDFVGISQWLNSAPLTVADLKGSVVLIHFWTYTCINCQRTMPYVTRWHQQYAEQGLQTIGVHTPEFSFERDPNNVRQALKKYQVTYPVPLDNQYQTWRAYQNRYWPRFYLASRGGRIVYDHIGEGAYNQTEQMIQRLLGS